MRQYRSDKHPSRIEVDSGNQAQLVSANVEHEYIAHLVSAGEQLSQLREIAPFGLFAQPVPLFQSTRALRMLLLRSHDAAVSDDVHGGIISQLEILCVLGWRAEKGSRDTCQWLPQLEKADEFGIRTYSDADPNRLPFVE